MAHELDHVFVMCSPGAPEAEALIEAGLREGSPNTHPGQGTACRRFFFDNAYLELVWVSDAAEVLRPAARPTRLFDRWSGRDAGACPFGVVLRPAGALPGEPPFDTWTYSPSYFPPGVAIEIAVGTQLTEPELFYCRLPRRPDALPHQPTEHTPSRREITGLTIGMRDPSSRTAAIRAAEGLGLLSCVPSAEHLMTLEFDEGRARRPVDLRPRLPLVLR
jgi:hypothetical protein